MNESATSALEPVSRAHREPPLAASSRVSGILVRVLADAAQQHGIAPDALLHGGSLELAHALRPDTWIPLGEFRVLFARALSLTAEPALGLHCGLSASEPSFELIAPLISHARTLRHAIELARQFHPLFIEHLSLRFSENAGRAELRCEYPRTEPLFDRSLAELLLAGMMRMLRAFAGTPADVHTVSFEHERPAYYHAYAAAFGGSARFAQPSLGIEFASALLDRPHLHGQPELQALLHAQAERRLERLSRPATFVEQLQAYLQSAPPTRSPDMALAARGLGMSVRSLRRRLDEEGSSFREVTRAALQEQACSLLRNRDVTVQEASHTLGFADSTAFHRAFKRWTGLTPAQYRDRALAATGTER